MSTTIARTYRKDGKCLELLDSSDRPHGTLKYFYTLDGQVIDARTCWLTIDNAAAMWDESAYKLGARPE